MRLIAPILAALAFAPAALAGTPLNTVPVTNSEHAEPLLTSAGTELVTWADGGSGLWLWSSKTGAQQIKTIPFVEQPQIVQLPSGAIEIYVGSGTGVLRTESTDDGKSWSSFSAMASPTTTGPVVSAAVRPDGTPMFTQDSTFGIDVYQGLNGEQRHTVFTQCCGYAESLAVDRFNYAQIAFWSNAASFPNLFVYEGLDANGGQAGPGRAFGQPETAPHDDLVPLVAAPDGYTYMGFAAGYPTASAFAVNVFQGGNLGWSTVVAGGTFGGADPHMALATDSSSRVWAVWTQGGALHACRSRSDGHHFGAPTAVPAGGSIYQLTALALPSGSVDLFANNGSQLLRTTLKPALTVKATHASVSVTDDGFGVKARLKAGGHTVTTNASGTASLTKFRKGTRITVTAPGYAPASLTRP